jgi:Isochorismatase family
MLHPSSSVLAIVDAPVIDPNSTLSSIAAIKTLRAVADLLEIPIVPVRFPNTMIPGQIATTAAVSGCDSDIPFDPAAPDWLTTQLGKAIAKTSRNQMIVSGFWLEEAVTFLVLRGLSIGVDTYVTVDATTAINPEFALAAYARLTQAGAVPTTTEQILREWSALSVDTNVQAKILAMLS